MSLAPSHKTKVPLFLLVWWLLAAATAQPTKEYDFTPTEFKAAILSKIPSNVQWPETAFTNTDNQLVIGIFGNDAADDDLEKMLTFMFKDKPLAGHPVVVKRIVDLQPTNKCHILFVPAAYNDQWLELSKKTDPVGLLTVGESDDFLKKRGGVFNLLVPDRRLEIYQSNAKKAELQINSKLLKIAKIVK